MLVDAVKVTRQAGGQGDVEVTLTDDWTGKAVTIRAAGQLGTSLTARDSGFLQVEIQVIPPRKAESVSSNLPGSRFPA